MSSSDNRIIRSGFRAIGLASLAVIAVIASDTLGLSRAFFGTMILPYGVDTWLSLVALLGLLIALLPLMTSNGS